MSLIPESTPQDKQSTTYQEIPIAQLSANPAQPRKDFDQDKLQLLAESIKEQGIIQPIVVKEDKGTYQIIAGERRWRAAQIAGLKTVPIIVRNAEAIDTLIVALTENVQRNDLNPIEEALGYGALVTKYGLTQEEIAEKVGKKRSTIANALRLLKLPDEIKDSLKRDEISAGHAKALLSQAHNEQRNLFNKICSQKLSVRDVEGLLAKDKPAKIKRPQNKPLNPAIHTLLQRLEEALETRIKAHLNEDMSGWLKIRIDSIEDLKLITDRISAQKADKKINIIGGVG